MEIDSYREGKLQAYSVLFNRTRFGFVSKINMDNLKYFSIENQQTLGKIDILININAIKRLPNNKNLNYLVMTQYQQIIPLIYLLRSQPPNCKILTTKIMLQTAKLYAHDFYQVIKKKNQVVAMPTYEQQSQAYDNYQIKFHIDFGEWVPIYESDEIEGFASRALCLNYGQVYNTDRGTLLTPYPSGLSIGSAVWMFQNQQTNNKCLWVQGMSHHNWRACQQFYIDPIHQQINCIVFTVGVLANSSTTVQDEYQCLQFLKTISQRINKGINNRIVLHDFLVIPDIINYVFYQMKDKLKKIFFTGVSMNKIMSYVNSYPQFLTWNHKKRIYEDPPVYPFETYQQFREKVISEGNLQQISAQNKVPLKQLHLKSTPYIQFQADFYAFLVEGQNEVHQNMFQKFYDLNRLKAFLQQRKIGKIICICKQQSQIKNIPDLEHSFTLNLLENNIFVPDESINKYYTTQGQFPNIICKYHKKNGWLRLTQFDQKFRFLSKDWHLKMEVQFKNNNIQVLKKEAFQFQTSKTSIKIENYKIYVKSSCQKQLQIIQEIFNQHSKVSKLKL